MSGVNIPGLVATIKDTNVYIALVEAVNNSLQSIEASGRKDGKIKIELIRSAPGLDIKVDGESEDASLPDVTAIYVSDNGQGFTDENIASFDEAYTQSKVEMGGKGFGRFVYLKHFSDVEIISDYQNQDGTFSRRTFSLGKKNDIVDKLKTVKDVDTKDSWTTVKLLNIRETTLDKKLSTISRKLLERILVQFTREGYMVPEIEISDDTSEELEILNKLLNDSKYAEIEQLEPESFAFEAGEMHEFKLHLFKVWFPGTQSSKISLASNCLEVTKAELSDYINEFESGFVGNFENRSGQTSNRFILKAYVTGKYLDKNVNRERSGFDFGKKPDGLYPIGKTQIERAAADKIKERFKSQFQTERKKKTDKLKEIAQDKSWLRNYSKDVNLSTLKVSSTPDEYEIALEVARIKRSQELSLDVETLVQTNAQALTDAQTESLVKQVSRANKEDLARYVAKRKAVLDILEKSMKTDDATGKYSSERLMHDIIYPTKKDSDEIDPNYQNLWILDERLNFTEYVSSDKKLSKENANRPDLLLFHQQVAFRAGDEKQNPISIVEFKRPGRDDFASQTSLENPIKQVIRYTNDIREGKYTAPGGRPIHTDEQTQFYGYVVIEFTEKVKRWLKFEEDFTPMPDGLGYFKFYTGTNLYIEILSWDKILKDSKLRNRIFIDKLGL